MKITSRPTVHRLLWLGGGVLIAWTGLSLWTWIFEPRVDLPPQPVALQAEGAAAAMPQSEVTASGGPYVGVVLARQEVEVSAESQGQLERVYVRVGDVVTSGQRLASLDTRELQHQLAIERANLQAAQADQRRLALSVSQAKGEYARRQQLKDVVSAEEIEAAAFARDTAIAAREAAEARETEVKARISQLQERLARSEIRAPYAGTIALRLLDEGSLVGPGTPVVRLISSGDLLLRFAVPPEEADALKLGTRVEARLDELPLTLHGTVEHLAPEIDLASQLVFVEARVEETLEGQRFPTGGAAEVRIVDAV